MYLIDTNIISEARKGHKADRGVQRFFKQTAFNDGAIYLSAISIGELRKGVELIRHRGDAKQAHLLEAWLADVLETYRDKVLAFDSEAAQVWGRLRVPHAEHELDKQVAAVALTNDLTVVTRNVADFSGTGCRLMNPFEVG